MTQSQAHNKNMSDPLIGREVKDYRFVDKLGGGAFGAVYKAEHIRLGGRSVAIKVLHPHIASDESIVERFRREARSLSGLNHPNIVQIIDFDWHEEFGFYLVLEMLIGDALNKVLKIEKRIPQDIVVTWFTHLLSALQEAHNQGIVHRDLKPANLMILDSGPQRVLKILDFGIASLNDTEHELTTDGTAMGSANYMSPEQALGQIKKIDTRSDLYSCGIILGKCLTGKNVYAADSPTQILWKHIYEPPPLLKSLYPAGNFSQALEDVFAKSIAKEKDARFQSAHEFLQALQAAVEQAPAPAPKVDSVDEAEETIFDASYTNSLKQRAAAEASMSNRPVAVPRPVHTPVAAAAPVAARPAAAASPGMVPMTTPVAAVARPITAAYSSFQASQERDGIPMATGQYSSSGSSGRTGVHSISDLHSAIHKASPSSPPATSTLPLGAFDQGVRPVQIRDRTRTGIRPISSQEAEASLAGESSASFSSSAIRPSPDRPTPRRSRPTQNPLRYQRRGSWWDEYKWWVIGGSAGALLLVFSVVAYFALTKPAAVSVPRRQDPAKLVNPDLTWDKIDKEFKQERKPEKRK